MTDAPKPNQDQRRDPPQSDTAGTRANREQRPPDRAKPSAEASTQRSVGDATGGPDSRKTGVTDTFHQKDVDHKRGSPDSWDRFKNDLAQPDAQPSTGSSEKINQLRNTLNDGAPTSIGIGGVANVRDGGSNATRGLEARAGEALTTTVDKSKLNNPPRSGAQAAVSQGLMANRKPNGAASTDKVAVSDQNGAKQPSDKIGGDRSRDAQDHSSENNETKRDNNISGDQADTGKADINEREKARVAEPKDGVGFAHNSDKVSPSSLQSWIDGQSKSNLAAVKDGTAHLEVTGHASRDGGSVANYTLSESRASNAGDALASALNIDRDLILTQGTGEAKAKAEGHPDGVDNAEDRVTDINIVLDRDQSEKNDNQSGNVGDAVKSATDALPQVQQDKNADDHIDMVVERGKALVNEVSQEFWKNPESLPEIILDSAMKEGIELAKHEVLWGANKLANDLDPAGHRILENIQSEAVSGMQDALTDWAGT